MTAEKAADAPTSRTRPGIAVSVATVHPTARREAAVVLTIAGAEVTLSPAEAFDLQRRILSATVGLEREDRRVEAARKAEVQRELRRAASVDEAHVARDGGV